MFSVRQSSSRLDHGRPYPRRRWSACSGIRSSAHCGPASICLPVAAASSGAIRPAAQRKARRGRCAPGCRRRVCPAVHLCLSSLARDRRRARRCKREARLHKEEASGIAESSCGLRTRQGSSSAAPLYWLTRSDDQCVTPGSPPAKRLSARFSSSTFTRASPSSPNCRGVMWDSTSSRTLSTGRCRSCATRCTW